MQNIDNISLKENERIDELNINELRVIQNKGYFLNNENCLNCNRHIVK